MTPSIFCFRIGSTLEAAIATSHNLRGRVASVLDSVFDLVFRLGLAVLLGADRVHATVGEVLNPDHAGDQHSRYGSTCRMCIAAEASIIARSRTTCWRISCLPSVRDCGNDVCIATAAAAPWSSHTRESAYSPPGSAHASPAWRRNVCSTAGRFKVQVKFIGQCRMFLCQPNDPPTQ